MILIKVVICDDMTLLAESLKIVVEGDPMIEVVGLAKNGYEAYELCKTENPDIVILDIKMPECDGINGTKLIKSYNKNIKVIILTTFCSDENVSEAIRNGADGFITKGLGPVQLQQTIKSIYMGLGIIEQNDIWDRVKKSMYAPEHKLSKELIFEKFHITSREIEIIRHIVDGKGYRELSKELYVSEGTARNYVSEIIQKLGLKDRIQLAIFAVKNKIV